MASSLVAAVLLLLAVSSALSVAATSSAEQREFDYFLLSLQWPGTYCQTTRHCCPKNGCCRSLPLTEFTIHGLWTDYNDGSWPSCCSGSEFDIKKISSLIPVLEKYWPTLSCSSSSLCRGGKGLFWAHEWEKHGTCSYPVIQNEYDYFSTALDLYFKYNITRILESAGFQATNSERYPLGDIVAAVKKAVGASPSLECKHGSLQELHLCFYKDFKPRDCVIESRDTYNGLLAQSSCPRYIILPTFEPLVIEKENVATRAAPITSFPSDWRAVAQIQELFG